MRLTSQKKPQHFLAFSSRLLQPFATRAGLGSIKVDLVKKMRDSGITEKHFDVAVIGGGSGGIALAYEAKRLGMSVVLFDYVVPSPNGNKWGLGGTCVNVGCIPKKLMHNAALLKHEILKAPDFGYALPIEFEEGKEGEAVSKLFDWSTLVSGVQSHIRSLNFGYKTQMVDQSITYLNALAQLSETPVKGREGVSLAFSPTPLDPGPFPLSLSASYAVLALGTRPFVPESLQHISPLTSDDIFFLKKSPGKTLVIGGGYVAVETAGFLKELGGGDVTLIARDKFLRSFDREMGDSVLASIAHEGVRVIQGKGYPKTYKKLEDGRVQTVIDGQEEIFDTVVVATGRNAVTKEMNLDRYGIKVNSSNGKVIGGVDGEAEKIGENLFAIGDVLQGVPELTPVASQSGTLLAQRIKMRVDEVKKGLKVDRKQFERRFMDYENVPTTVFTPLEYSCVGLTEEKAIEMFGNEQVEVYHSKTTPLEEALIHRVDEEGHFLRKKTHFKAICKKEEGSSTEKVVGLHYIGPNAGEIMQGFAVALRLGLTKEALDGTVGIHPTIAEEFVGLDVTKSSGEDPEKSSC